VLRFLPHWYRRESGFDGKHPRLCEELSRLRSAFMSAPIALCLVDRDLRYVEVNQRMAMLNRRPIEAHLGRTLREVVPEIADAIEPVYRQIFKDGLPVERRLISEDTNDGERFVLVNYNPVKDEAGMTILVSVSVLDVTMEKRARDQANAAAQKLHDVLESSSDSIILLSWDLRVTYINGHAKRLFESNEPALGSTLPELIPGWAESGAGEKLAAVGGVREAQHFEAYFASLDRWLQFDLFPTKEGLSMFLRDVSDRRRAEEGEQRAREKILFLATHDGLTGLANRSTFYDALERMLGEIETHREIVVLYLDLDGFKAVNDTKGHPIGDAVLIAVSERLRHCTEGTALVCRIGGDEFVIAKTDPGSESDVAALAEAILGSLSCEYEVGGEVIAIGASIGIALAKSGLTSDELVRRADVALYAAKAAGRGNYRFFEPGMGNELFLRELRKRELAQALHRNELALEFQPIFDLKTGRVATFEALLRWRHPDFASVPTDSVIAIAEETGLIHSIGEWVLREACKEVSGWPDAVLIAVNVSVLQIQSRSFGEKVKGILAETGVKPTRLTLEITETIIFVGERQATDTLDDLRHHGVRISLDDFGKGYASLQYLKKFKVDMIKIDQSFVLDSHSSFESLAILRAVVALARAFGVATVAEGIELASQYELLLQEGCDFGQGYFLGRPMSSSDCHQLIQQQLGLGLM
jgi:diguanylate cyclase (GGDEF)-like protein/PAS domain S-box-containing protein